MANRWHVQREEGRLVLSRRLPARFDVVAETTVPFVIHPLRLAHQVRQDLWRALKSVRGFVPVVEIGGQSKNLALRAGGTLLSPCNLHLLSGTIYNLLENAAFRSRWVRNAGGQQSLSAEEVLW